MNILIIDDEPPVRESIRLLIPWEHYNVAKVREAQSGIEALQMIQEETPQIVFTDIRMPMMDGIEVLKWIREHEPHIKVIVISGYNDFDYVRSALKYGSFDYILKPIDEEELLEVFEKALNAWRLEEQSRAASQQINMRANQFKPVLTDNMFSRLLQDPDQYRAVAKTLNDEYNLGQVSGHCRVAVINLCVLDASLRRKFASALDLLVFSITNICNELVQQDNRGIAFQNLNEKHEVVVLFLQHTKSVDEMIRRIQDALFTALRSRFYIGVGRSLPFPQGLPQAYAEAQHALKHRNLLDEAKHEHYYEEQKMTGLHHPLSDYEDRLFLAMKRNDEASISALLEEWGERVKENDSISIRELELWWQEFVLLLTKWSKDFSPEQGEAMQAASAGLAFELPLDDQDRLSLDSFVQRMTQLLIERGRLFSEQQQPGHTIAEIEQFVRAFYCQDINLQMLADQFYLSPSHISRTFKQHFGENLIDYISRLRIERAKVLLTDPTLKISTIASSVGYQDEKYFSKAFKRFEGISPKEFRKLHIQ